MTERSHKGLVQREVTVRRGGKTFKQMRWIKPGDEEPKEDKGKKEEVKGKGLYKIGRPFEFMGKNQYPIKIDEKQQTIKLNDGKVYTFEAIKYGIKSKEIKKEPSIKDLKIKKPEKEIEKEIPIGTPITEKNAEEICKIGSLITIYGKSVTITNRNGSILEYTNQDGTKDIGSINGLIDSGAVTRNKDSNDKKTQIKTEKKIKVGETEIERREKQFSKVRRPSKKIGAKTIPTKLKIGDSIIVEGKESKIDYVDKNIYKIGSKIYAAKTIHKITNEYPLVTGEKVKGNYKFTNDKEQDKKISETINKLDNLMLDGKSIEDAIKEVISGKKGSLKSNINLPKFDKESMKVVKDTLLKLNKYISPKYKESGLEVNIENNTTGRCYALPETNTISLVEKNTMDSSLMHEVGHIMENNHGNNRKVIDDFLRSRTGNLSDQKKLNDVFPNCGYTDNEITCKDKFIDAYTGKIYYKQVESGRINTNDTSSSEILSMGMQKFNNEDSMKEFYRQDKEHFAVTLSVMAGDFL